MGEFRTSWRGRIDVLAVAIQGGMTVFDREEMQLASAPQFGSAEDHVYFFDRDQRSLWPDEEFRSMFPALHPSIEEYLRRRRAGQLPPKPEGYDSLYLLGRGFNEFLARLTPADADDAEPGAAAGSPGDMR